MIIIKTYNEVNEDNDKIKRPRDNVVYDITAKFYNSRAYSSRIDYIVGRKYNKIVNKALNDTPGYFENEFFFLENKDHGLHYKIIHTLVDKSYKINEGALTYGDMIYQSTNFIDDNNLDDYFNPNYRRYIGTTIQKFFNEFFSNSKPLDPKIFSSPTSRSRSRSPSPRSRSRSPSPISRSRSRSKSSSPSPPRAKSGKFVNVSPPRAKRDREEIDMDEIRKRKERLEKELKELEELEEKMAGLGRSVKKSRRFSKPRKRRQKRQIRQKPKLRSRRSR
jgi:hypothetical protein